MLLPVLVLIALGAPSPARAQDSGASDKAPQPPAEQAATPPAKGAQAAASGAKRATGTNGAGSAAGAGGAAQPKGARAAGGKAAQGKGQRAGAAASQEPPGAQGAAPKTGANDPAGPSGDASGAEARTGAPSDAASAPAPQAPGAPQAPVEEEPPAPPRELRTLVPERWLVIEPTDEPGRRPFRPDAVFDRYLAFPGAAMPSPDDVLSGETVVQRRWTERTTSDGVLAKGFGYAFTTIELEAGEVWLVDLQGAETCFVNGVPFVGDPYGYGVGGVPVPFKKGPNHVFVRGPRSDVRFALREPSAPIFVATSNAVVPDLVAGGDFENDDLCSLVLVNATQESGRPMTLTVRSPDGYFKDRKIDLAGIGPLALRPVFLTLARAAPPDPDEKPGAHALELALALRGQKPFTRATLEIQVKEPTDARRQTFDSLIDGSIQSFAVLPPSDPGDPSAALALSLHGAGVDALAQAQAYSPKHGFWIVAPTNRRPFGFDWQDWGRDDAYDVLDVALRLTKADPARVFLTGHSMGGHGTWHLAATDPWRFAAIAPSAGWSSFDSYGGRPDGELAWLWHAADAASRTEDLISNLRATPTYLLHGEQDESVDVDEARRLESALVAAGGRVTAHYQPGAGHWWDGDAAAGADCVDWPEIFELFRATPARILGPTFDYVCADPSIQATFGPFVLDQPREYGVAMHVAGRWDAGEGRLAIETTNVRRLRVDFSKIESVAVRVKLFEIDGQQVDVWRDLRLAQIGDPTWFVRESETWAQDAARGRLSLSATWRAFPDDEMLRWDGEKNSETCGPFKRAFDRQFALVYGTGGSPQENRALQERARADQMTWWYRANALPSVLADFAFLADEARKGGGPTRNAILYGNSRTNKAWGALVPAEAPIRVRPGSIELGAQRWTGNDLLAVFVLPRADVRRDKPPYLRDPKLDPKLLRQVPAWPLVGVIADTGLAGIRLGHQLEPFRSGVGYPDYAIVSGAVSRAGDGGVLAAGWFDHRWRLQPGGYLHTPLGEADGSR